MIVLAERNQQFEKTSNNNYFTKRTKHHGYFTADGNLILEHYDEATDTVTITTYSVGK
jgi:hypothetical protein